MSLSVTKWGILKYLFAKISSETTKSLDFQHANKKPFDWLKYE